MKLQDIVDKVVIALLIAAITAASAAYVKLERLEAKFEALNLEKVPAQIQELEKNGAVMTIELKSINDNIKDLKEIVRSANP